MPEHVGPFQPARARIDVFTIRLDLEKGKQFSLDGISEDVKAAGALLEALGKFGETNLAYRFDEQVDLGEMTNMTIGSQVPVVQNIVMSKGKPSPSVTFRQIGCILDMGGNWQSAGPDAVAALRLDFELSGICHSDVDIGVPGVKLPQFTQFQSRRQLQARDGQFVLTSVLQERKNEKGDSVGYDGCVLRLRLDRLDRK